MVDFSVRAVSGVPVVPQKTRRAFVQFEQSVQGMWTIFGYPYDLAEKQARTHAEWYYPGGYIQDVGNYPREDPNMLGWDIFFTFNPDPERTVHCRATFVYETEDPQVIEFDVGPHRQSRDFLQLPQYRHLTRLNRPYAVRLESDGPLVPHFLRAEYESWGWINPTAMFGIIPFEGPLIDQTEWYYAEGFWQEREDHPWIEQEWIAIFNPGREDAAITVSFFLDEGVREHHDTVTAGVQKCSSSKTYRSCRAARTMQSKLLRAVRLWCSNPGGPSKKAGRPARCLRQERLLCRSGWTGHRPRQRDF